MTALSYFFIFFFGLAVGSFLNCVIYRLEEGKSFLKGRSYCPHCKHNLSWQDLVPVLSFLILRGKCRYCRGKISVQYPLVEIATGLLFVSAFWISPQPLSRGWATQPIGNGLWSDFGLWILISSFLIIIFVYDLKHYIIPDRVIYPAILVSGIWYPVSGIFFDSYTEYDILNTIYSAVGAALFFLIIVLVSRGKWMGVGDIKLAFLMGLILGWPNILVALFLAFSIGAIVGISLIILKKKGLKSEVPFGPFLVAGTFLALFWGGDIVSWYLGLIMLK
ncbi:MAG: prepilin peptidase [Candidatus Wildermuthbacteria bacterium]|nr:prepilin peptidase [Candidatus Wildermuthbacteria bacterium]